MSPASGSTRVLQPGLELALARGTSLCSTGKPAQARIAYTAASQELRTYFQTAATRQQPWPKLRPLRCRRARCPSPGGRRKFSNRRRMRKSVRPRSAPPCTWMCAPSKIGADALNLRPWGRRSTPLELLGWIPPLDTARRCMTHHSHLIGRLRAGVDRAPPRQGGRALRS